MNKEIDRINKIYDTYLKDSNYMKKWSSDNKGHQFIIEELFNFIIGYFFTIEILLILHTIGIYNMM